jgi:hypothetical protein
MISGSRSTVTPSSPAWKSEVSWSSAPRRSSSSASQSSRSRVKSIAHGSHVPSRFAFW